MDQQHKQPQQNHQIENNSQLYRNTFRQIIQDQQKSLINQISINQIDQQPLQKDKEQDIDVNQQKYMIQQDEKQLEIDIQEQNNEVNQLQLPSINQQPLQSQQKIIKKKSETVNHKQQKGKKKKVRQYIQDFTPFLPQFMLILNKTTIPAIIRIGNRYQATVPKNTPFQKMYQSIQQLLIWDGNNNASKQPKQQNLIRFKQLLGDNRTEQQLIHIGQRLKLNSWKQVLEYVSRNKSQLRRIFHMSQRNRI